MCITYLNFWMNAIKEERLESKSLKIKKINWRPKAKIYGERYCIKE